MATMASVVHCQPLVMPFFEHPAFSSTSLMWSQGRLSGAELVARAQERATALRHQGLSRGDLVLCEVTGASAEFSIMQVALWLNQAALMPVADRLEASAARTLADHTGADWWWQPCSSRIDRTASVDHGRLVATSTRRADHNQSSPLALVVQTSGSSGGRKAVMLSRAALRASCECINDRLGLAAEDLWLCALPRQHIGGLAISYRCALAGASLLLHQGFESQRVAADLWGNRVTHLSLVPPMLARLLKHCPRPPQWLRVVLMGGQALDVGLARRALADGWPLHLGYGMTETCSFIASRQLNEATDADLLPLPGVVFDAPTCVTPAPTKALRLKAPMLMSGYANPERRPCLGLEPDGWLRSADLACLTHARQLHILGRADDQLVIAGVNVHPRSIEQQLSECPCLTQCALVGLPEPVWGHTLVALYQGTLTVAALDAWCRAHLPSPQRPRLFVPLLEWPLLASGKLDRVRLRDLAVEAWRRRSNDAPPSVSERR